MVVGEEPATVAAMGMMGMAAVAAAAAAMGDVRATARSMAAAVAAVMHSAKQPVAVAAAATAVGDRAGAATVTRVPTERRSFSGRAGHGHHQNDTIHATSRVKKRLTPRSKPISPRLRVAFLCSSRRVRNRLSSRLPHGEPVKWGRLVM